MENRKIAWKTEVGGDSPDLEYWTVTTTDSKGNKASVVEWNDEEAKSSTTDY